MHADNLTVDWLMHDIVISTCQYQPSDLVKPLIGWWLSVSTNIKISAIPIGASVQFNKLAM